MAHAIFYNWYNNSHELRFEELRDLVCSLEGADAFKKSGISFDDLLDQTNILLSKGNNTFSAVKNYFHYNRDVLKSKKEIRQDISNELMIYISKKDFKKAIKKLVKSGKLLVTREPEGPRYISLIR